MSTSKRWAMDRRTLLKGLGATVALPMLDVMMPSLRAAQAAAGAGASAIPLRTAFVFVPNGVHMPDFTPTGLGAGYDLPPTLEPLARLKDKVSVLSGLAHDNARAKGDGPGDHARASAAFLTGAHPHKTAGADIKLGVSVDQYLAQRIGQRTRLASLELGCDRGRMAGRCDSGYSCAYVSNISWSGPTTPVAKEVDPAAVFDRLFGSADEREARAQRNRRLAERKSVLDYVRGETKQLNGQIGTSDRRKLDEFETAIRDIERRIERAKTEFDDELPEHVQQPDGIPESHAAHQRLMYDMMTLAFEMDLTRIGTFMANRAGSNRSYREIGVSEGHHHLSHHRGDQHKIAQIRKIDRFNIEQFAYFLDRLSKVREGDGTLLDHCQVVLGSGISDGNRHRHEDLPVLLAGGAGGAITPGRHVRYKTNTPLCNLFVSMIGHTGVDASEFGDSNGLLTDLKA